MKTGIRTAVGLLFVALAGAHPAYALPDITSQTIPFNIYAQDALPSISADGRYVAYKVEGQGSGYYPRNLFIQDLLTGQKIPANITLTGKVGTDAGCDMPSMSADGRYVVFVCKAVPMGGVAKGGMGYFVYDRVANATQMIPDLGDDYAIPGSGAAISANGRYVAFRTQTVNGTGKIYVRDMVNKSTSATTAQFASGGSGTRLSISADGRYIAYLGRVGATVNPAASVYDRVTGVTEAVDVRPDGSRATGVVMEPTISDDGSAVVFVAADGALAPGANTKGFYSVFLRDRKNHKTELIYSVNNYYVQRGAVSGNGRYVAYLLSGYMYVYDRLTKASRKIVLSALNAYGVPRFSSDGRFVAFTSVNSIGNKQSVSIADLGVAPNVTVSAASLSLTEGGNAGTYALALTQAPDADVRVTVGAGTQLNLARSELTFTGDNWNQPQLVSVQAVDDGVVQGPHSATIAHTVTSADINYSVVQPQVVTVTITDGVTPTIIVPGATWYSTELPLSGTAAPGATVVLTAANRSTGWQTSVTALADAQGKWSHTLAGLTDGMLELDVQAEGIKGAAVTVTVAVTKPVPAPVSPIVPAQPGK